MRRTLILLLLLGLLIGLFPAAVAPAAPLPTASVVENFEAYADTSELENAWPDEDDGPTQTLVSTAHAGAQAMQFDYDVSGVPVASVSHTFAVAPDWSGMTRLTLWYQGFAGNSLDEIFLQLVDSSNTVLFQGSLSGTAAVGWNVWTLDLTQATGDLSVVDGFILGVQAKAGGEPGSGTVLFDDISVSNGEETVWIGTTDEWGLATNWTVSAPDVDMDARIPSAPSGGNMPVIKTSGADVHDLTIEAGASLDLGVHDLNVSGTLYNFGTVSQSQAVGANADVSFLNIGGHPGVTIVTGLNPPVTNSASVEGLGQTTVSIGGSQACTTGNNSIQRCYDITPEITTILSGDVQVTFYFEPGELNGNECQSLAVWHLANGVWEQVVASDSAQISHQCTVAPYSVTVTGMTNFSPVLLSAAQPVAIGLHTFGAAQQIPYAALALVAGLLALASMAALLAVRRWHMAR